MQTTSRGPGSTCAPRRSSARARETGNAPASGVNPQTAPASGRDAARLGEHVVAHGERDGDDVNVGGVEHEGQCTLELAVVHDDGAAPPVQPAANPLPRRDKLRPHGIALDFAHLLLFLQGARPRAAWGRVGALLDQLGERGLLALLLAAVPLLLHRVLERQRVHAQKPRWEGRL